MCYSTEVGLGGGVSEQRSKMVLHLGSGGRGNFGSFSTFFIWAVGGRSNDCTSSKSEPIGSSFQYRREWVGRYPQFYCDSRVDRE